MVGCDYKGQVLLVVAKGTNTSRETWWYLPDRVQDSSRPGYRERSEAAYRQASRPIAKIEISHEGTGYERLEAFQRFKSAISRLAAGRRGTSASARPPPPLIPSPPPPNIRHAHGSVDPPTEPLKSGKPSTAYGNASNSTTESLAVESTSSRFSPPTLLSRRICSVGRACDRRERD